MKILILTGDPRTLICHRAALLRSFARRGMEVVAAASGEHEAADEFLRSIGGRYVPIRLARSSLNPLGDVVAVRDIFRLIRNEQPGVIFSYAIKSVIYGSILSRLCGVPRIFALIPGLGYAFTPDGTWKQRFVNVASRVLYSVALRCVTKVFLQNHDDEKLLRERHILPRRVPSHVTMGSGVSLTEFPFRDLERDRDLRDGRFEFLLVSRLLRKKGIGEFAEAARRIRTRFPNASFKLIGPLDPSPDGVPESEIRAWEAGGALSWEGETSDIRPHLRKAQAFVLPTYYREGVPRVILEAMATGLPIVTTDAVGSRETVHLGPEARNHRPGAAGVYRGDNGFLVRPRDVNALCDAMTALIENPRQAVAMGRQSRELAEEHFNVSTVNAGILREMDFRGTAHPPLLGLPPINASSQSL